MIASLTKYYLIFNYLEYLSEGVKGFSNLPMKDLRNEGYDSHQQEDQRVFLLSESLLETH